MKVKINYLFTSCHIYVDEYDCVALNKKVVLAKKVQVNCHLSMVCTKSKAVSPLLQAKAAFRSIETHV